MQFLPWIQIMSKCPDFMQAQWKKLQRNWYTSCKYTRTFHASSLWSSSRCINYWLQVCMWLVVVTMLDGKNNNLSLRWEVTLLLRKFFEKKLYCIVLYCIAIQRGRRVMWVKTKNTSICKFASLGAFPWPIKYWNKQNKSFKIKIPTGWSAALLTVRDIPFLIQTLLKPVRRIQAVTFKYFFYNDSKNSRK